MSKTPASANGSWRQRVGITLAWAAMTVVFGAAGWIFAVKPLAVAHGNWWTARDYQAVEAQVVERKSADADGSFNWYTARYQRDDKTYDTHRLTVLDDENIDEQSNASVLKTLARAYEAKQPVAVWVSPRKPEVAIVTRNLPIASLWGRWPMAIGFTVFAIAGVFGALGCALGLAYYQRMVDAAGLWLFSSLWCGFIFPFVLVVANAEEMPWVPMLIVGFFALIGGLMLYGAVAASLKGTATPSSMAAGERGTQLADEKFNKIFGKQKNKASKGKKS
jgi:hypothetical protein